MSPSSAAEAYEDDLQRKAMALGAIDTLRAEPGSHVEILSRMDGREAVYVAASWTGHIPVRFEGDTLLQALSRALHFRDAAIARSILRAAIPPHNN